MSQEEKKESEETKKPTRKIPIYLKINSRLRTTALPLIAKKSVTPPQQGRSF